MGHDSLEVLQCMCCLNKKELHDGILPVQTSTGKCAGIAQIPLQFDPREYAQEKCTVDCTLCPLHLLELTCTSCSLISLRHLNIVVV